MAELTFLKLGGSLITDKERPHTLRAELLQRLAAEIAARPTPGGGTLVVGHGSGSFGHHAARLHGLGGRLESERQRRGVAATQVQAARLHLHVLEALDAAGAAPFSVAPSNTFTAAGGRVRRVVLEPLLGALRLGLLPVVYGDVVLDSEWGGAVVSTEAVLAALAGRLRRRGLSIRRVLWLGETAGIYDGAGRTVPEIHSHNLAEVRAALGPARGTDVTGGMLLRLDTACWLARRGIDSWILDGREPLQLRRALAGEPSGGTVVRGRRFRPAPPETATKGRA